MINKICAGEINTSRDTQVKNRKHHKTKFNQKLIFTNSHQKIIELPFLTELLLINCMAHSCIFLCQLCQLNLVYQFLS